MRKYILAAIGMIVACAAVYFYSNNIRQATNLNYYGANDPLGGDFIFFWSVGHLSATGQGLGAYDPPVLKAVMRKIIAPDFSASPFFYPPHLMTFLTPYGMVPYFTGFMAFFMTGLVLFLTAVWRWSGRWTALFMLGYGGVWVNLVTGQMGLLYAGLFGFAMWSLTRHPVWSGVLVGLLTFKPHLGVLWPLTLIAGRHWRTSFSVFATLFAIAVAMGALYGPAIWSEALKGPIFAAFALADGGIGKLGPDVADPMQYARLYKMMPSFYTFLRLQYAPAPVAIALQGTMFLLLAYYTCRLWRLTADNGLRMGLLAAATAASAPFIYNYDLVLLAWPIVVLVMRQRLRWFEWLMVTLTYVWPLLAYRAYHVTGYQVGFIVPLLMFMVMARRIVVEKPEATPESTLPAQPAMR